MVSYQRCVVWCVVWNVWRLFVWRLCRVVWCGVVWCGVVCCVVLWCGVLWCVWYESLRTRRVCPGAVPKCTYFGWKNTCEQAPGVPATRGALDNEELFVIEGSKNDPWRSTPENWRSAKNAAFHGKKTITDVIRAAC